MARISVYDSYASGQRWDDLVQHFNGDRDRAMGSVIFLLLAARDHTSPTKPLIPAHVWKEEALDDALIDVGYAERRPGGVLSLIGPRQAVAR